MADSIKINIEDFKKEIKSKFEKSLTKKDDFKDFRLKFNPFPPAAIAKYHFLEPVDDKVTKKIIKFLKSTYVYNKDDKLGDFAGLTIVGEYGYGKTHILKYIEYIINVLNSEEDVPFKAFTAFVDIPEDTPQKIVHRIIEKIEPDTLRRLIWIIISNEIFKDNVTFKNNYFKGEIFSNQVDTYLLIEPIKTSPLIFYERFKKYGGDLKKFREDCRSIIEKYIVKDTSLAERYINLIFPEKNLDTSWDVLAGYLISKDIQKKEVMFLNSIVKILSNNNINMLYVFIDEFEDLKRLKGTKLTNYINTLTTMINNQRKWAIVVSLTEDALQEIKSESTPLYDRLTTDIIRLDRLNNKTAEKLVISYLNLGRKKTSNLYPFSTEIINELVKISEGNHRVFLQHCNSLIIFCASNKIKAPFSIEALTQSLQN